LIYQCENSNLCILVHFVSLEKCFQTKHKWTLLFCMEQLFDIMISCCQSKGFFFDHH